MTRLTLIQIASNPGHIVASAGGPANNGNFVGWLTFDESRNFRPIVNTAPIYPTEKAAIEAMKKLIEFAKKWVDRDIKDPDCAKELGEIVTPPAA